MGRAGREGKRGIFPSSIETKKEYYFLYSIHQFRSPSRPPPNHEKYTLRINKHLYSGGAFWTLPLFSSLSLLFLLRFTYMVTSDCVTTVNGDAFAKMQDDFIRRHHKHDVKDHQCTSSLVKHIKAPLHLVWSLVRRFDEPQKYKPFVSRCIVEGDLRIGSVREVNVKSGLPATTSTERLELLDDEEHIFSMKIVGGDHRLKNYSSVVTLHPEVIDGRPGTLVIESFVVDVPDGNTKDETCYFVEALIKCNLKSLADVSERLAVQDRTEPIDRMHVSSGACS